MKNETKLLKGTGPESLPTAPILRSRFDRLEFAGAFADLGTLIPFVTAYIAVLKMDPLGILLAFGVSMVASG